MIVAHKRLKMPSATFVAVAIVMAAIGAFAFFLTNEMYGPITHADEGSYLIGAAALSGKLLSSPVLGYYSGYSLLLVPAFLGSGGDIQAYYQLALWTNCALLVLAALAFFDLLSTIFPGQPTYKKLLAVLCLGLHPAALAYTQVSMSEVASIAVLITSLAMASRAVTNGGMVSLILSAVAAGFLFLINPRGLFLGGASCLFVLGSMLLGRLPARRAGLFLLVYVATLCMHWPLEMLALKVDGAGETPYDANAVLKGVGDFSRTASILANFVGGLVTIGLATCMLPLIQASRFDRREWRNIGQAELLLLSLLAAAVSTAALTAVFFANPSRADYLVYERYLAPCTVPLLAIAAMALLAKRFRIDHRDASVGILCLLLGLALLFFLADSSVLASPFNFLNAPSWFLWEDVLEGFDVLGNGLLAVALVALLLAVIQRRPHAAVVGLILFLAFESWYFSKHFFWPQSQHADSTREIVNYLTKLDAKRDEQICVERLSGLNPWTSVDARLFLMKYLASWEQKGACVLKFQVMPPAEAQSSGLELVASDGKQDLGLYTDPARAAELRAAGFALPAGFPSPLPGGALAGDIQLIDALPEELEAGEEVSVRAKVHHRGTGALWPKTGKAGLYAVRVGITYQTLPLGSKPRDEARSDLHLTLFPGEVQELPVPVRAPILPGDYRVCVGVLQEGVAWINGGSDSDADCAQLHVLPAGMPAK